MPKLQLAVDFVEFERAKEIAEECKNFVDIIEVGTPLIKSEGMNVVREFKRNFKDKIICADMKTIDTGRIEVEMAAKSGADIVCILGVSDDAVIEECLKAGKNYGCRIMVDMMNVENFIEKSKKILQIDNNAIICMHLGIDQQMRGKNLIDELKNLSKSINKDNIAAAGGINLENVKEISKFAEIIIVGQAITKSRNAS
ncbi:MAG: 3-hexulose-6-phosphate synthase, partial [Candidatus Altarchaeaceae archaeon]